MRKYELSINNKSFTIAVKEFSTETATVEVNGKSFKVDINDVIDSEAPLPPKKTSPRKALPTPVAAPVMGDDSGGAGTVVAPIPGVILELFVKTGDSVAEGQKVLKMEAMKMENIVNAPSAGTVTEINVAVGDAVIQGQKMLAIS